MGRKEIWNGAPNDGLGLSSVHGWALAALRTQGEITFFVDDVRLRREPLMENVPAGLSRETDIWVPVNELPMFGGYEPTGWQRKANEQFLSMVLPGFHGDHEAAAEHFAQTGWNFYYQDDKIVAIKRFNQAWLLDPDNQFALWGFAVISRERGKTDAALRFYRMAVDAGPAHPALKEEYESLRRLAAD
jgi:tetratricopeptide (TPR) repeat protein